nr:MULTISPECIES: hypothetical protein [unclassified Microbacterium]
MPENAVNETVARAACDPKALGAPEAENTPFVRQPRTLAYVLLCVDNPHSAWRDEDVVDVRATARDLSIVQGRARFYGVEHRRNGFFSSGTDCPHRGPRSGCVVDRHSSDEAAKESIAPARVYVGFLLQYAALIPFRASLILSPSGLTGDTSVCASRHPISMA